MSHDSEGMNLINVALDTCAEASVMNKDLFDTSFRDTDAVVSYTSLRSKALEAAEGSRRRARRAGAAASGFARKRHRAALRRLLPHGTLFLTRHMGPAKAVPLQTQLQTQ